MRYPDNIGITGKVFNKSDYIMSIKGKKEMNFNEIDNMTIHAELLNFIFIPTLGFKGQKNGIIQLFNKKIGVPNELDLKEIKPYQRLIGMLIEGVIETNRVMNIDINMRKVLNQLGERTGVFNREEFSYALAITNLEIVVDNLQKIIKDNEITKAKIIKRSSPHSLIN